MSKKNTLYTEIAGEKVAVSVTYENVTTTHITMRVTDKEAALIACYCHRAAPMTKIEKAADGGWLVVVYKTAQAA